ncbi:helix-turn-helix domain-containing protein [Rhodopirellula sp. JC740]|uniref:Helix-turn-helix domain-containing protein n=1 Tax=Rhodopirellula halodulae TaxID=2894198 RepID=A0ABS8NDP2_9BACT|nr:helix-turn-helix transcriptional regulator [Rhodopirellula sp. JC740]MCC9641675.1 helix-turn-helix domain-containing protein [Rhodopirellula sp. JC740]
MENTSDTPEEPTAPLARNLRKFRVDKGLSLDEVAKAADISKAYLWELERDKDGAKKPSAAVLMAIAKALSRSLAELLALPTVQSPTGPVELPASLEEFRKRLESQGQLLSDEDLRDLAGVRFRGAQPETADEWHQLYLLMASKARKQNK